MARIHLANPSVCESPCTAETGCRGHPLVSLTGIAEHVRLARRTRKLLRDPARHVPRRGRAHSCSSSSISCASVAAFLDGVSWPGFGCPAVGSTSARLVMNARMALDVQLVPPGRLLVGVLVEHPLAPGEARPSGRFAPTVDPASEGIDHHGNRDGLGEEGQRCPGTVREVGERPAEPRDGVGHGGLHRGDRGWTARLESGSQPLSFPGNSAAARVTPGGSPPKLPGGGWRPVRHRRPAHALLLKSLRGGARHARDAR